MGKEMTWAYLKGCDVGLRFFLKDRRNYSTFCANEKDLEGGKLMKLRIRNCWGP